MNIRPLVTLGFPGRDRLVHVAGLVHHIRRDWRVRFGWLFDHADNDVQE